MRALTWHGKHDVRVETVPDPRIRPHRLDLAKSMGAEVVNFEEVNVREALTEMTGGIGPDSCIDAVGMESHGFTADNILDKAKVAVGLATDRPHALRPTGQTHVQKYSEKLLKMILDDKLDTTFLISHRLPLEDAAHGYKIFKEEQNTVTKVVLHPGMNRVH